MKRIKERKEDSPVKNGDNEFMMLCPYQQCMDPDINRKFRDFHVKIVNEIISFFKENHINVDEFFLHADGLEESIEKGVWLPDTDSQFELRKFTKAWLEGEINEEEGKQTYLFSM